MKKKKSRRKEVIQKCVFIVDNENGSASSSPPPPQIIIPANQNSTRANSRRNRVYVYRDFLLSTFSHLLASSPSSPSLSSSVGDASAASITVLDVAGGRGDLSWILRNVDGVNSIIADPRIPNHKSLIKSTEFLLAHPDEAAVRAVEGLTTHQPLAKLLPRLMDNCDGNLSSPHHLRMHIDNNLVETMIRVLSKTHSQEEERMVIWNEFWQQEKFRIESNKVVFGGTTASQQTQKQNHTDDSLKKLGQITDSKHALDVLTSLDYIFGFHPDQATEAAIDLALFLKLPCLSKRFSQSSN